MITFFLVLLIISCIMVNIIEMQCNYVLKQYREATTLDATKTCSRMAGLHLQTGNFLYNHNI